MRAMLLCALLMLIAPFAQAHELRNLGHSVLSATGVAAASVAAATQPCGSGGASCYCSHACCFSANPEKLPPNAQRNAPLAPICLRMPQAFISIQAPREISPIEAFAAPRAPPRPL
jgi:hypothetical protein